MLAHDHGATQPDAVEVPRLQRSAVGSYESGKDAIEAQVSRFKWFASTCGDGLTITRPFSCDPQDEAPSRDGQV